eukprot:GILI01017062.1.p1 GENE.GILI01017062.1~~GILI01017062.1.p1  ORF type:complete len:373 (+),score=105.68 GILI01017062.1:52-1170(+)
MNPQTIQETRRVLAVVDDLIEDVNILSLLPPYFSALPQSDMKRITGAFEDAEAAKEVQSQLAEHYKTELRLESAAGGVTKDDIADHHLGTRALVDTLRQSGYADGDQPTVYQAPEAVKNFSEILTVMRNLLHDRLNTTVEDDVVKFVILNDTVNREKTASADVQALNREYHNEKESRKVEVERRRQQIQKLEEEIQRIRVNMEIDTENAIKIAREVAEQSEAKFNSKLEELKTEEEKATVDRAKVERNNYEGEKRIRDERTKRENELQSAINVYDKEMFSITQQIDELEKQKDENDKTQAELEGQLKVLGEESEAHRIERENDNKRREHVEALTGQMHESARLVQAFIRSFAVRQAALNKNKKKGKKGKKAK